MKNFTKFIKNPVLLKKWSGVLLVVLLIVGLLSYSAISLGWESGRPAVITFPGLDWFSIRIYTLLVITGLLAACGLFTILKQDLKVLKGFDIWDAVLFMLVPGLLGARVYYLLTTPGISDGVNGFLVNFATFNSGGMSIIGGIPAGIAGIYFYSKWKSLDLGTILNLAAISLPLAQIIGRFGNYFNQELYGYPTDVAWKMFISEPFRGVFTDASYFHPLFLYEILANIILLSVMLGLFYYLLKRNRQELEVQMKSIVFVKIYVVGYGLIRFILDFLRIDGGVRISGFTVTQVIILSLTIFVVVFGLGYQLWFKTQKGKWFTDHRQIQ